MKTPLFRILCSLVFASILTAAEEAKPAFTFDEEPYFHRWSEKDQHEFTPEDQGDLEAWTDMITINGYPDTEDADGLAEVANAVLDNYKTHQATVMKTDSVPRTAEREAEHFIAVAFPRPSFTEVVFARFKLIDGEGCSIVYSHRIYGEKTGDKASAWLKANGPDREKALMEWNSIPSSVSLRK